MQYVAQEKALRSTNTTEHRGSGEWSFPGLLVQYVSKTIGSTVLEVHPIVCSAYMETSHVAVILQVLQPS